MPPTTRPATPADVPAIVALSAAKRHAYAEVNPLFWRPAADANTRQATWFQSLLARDTTLAIVAEGAAGLAGFLVGIVHPAPPVYDPGGATCTVDDFCVRDPALWPTVGAALLVAVRGAARKRGVVQLVVVCGAHDEPKRALLARPGLTAASLWFTGPI